MPGHKQKLLLRNLLDALLREQPDSAGLVYLPSGEERTIRLIQNLLSLHPHDPDAFESSRFLEKIREEDEALYDRILNKK